ncbi:MAG: helix-turn-helix transcriptional regulator [Rhodobacteraceae bacterium]|nr:helix-turn-helix transcriptional regulator [Paracoccaceae bacterium]
MPKPAVKTVTPSPRRKNPKKGAKRAATEAAIVAAFDRLVSRDGLRNVGVNALVKEAGVGKGLIYQYFGGLAGVVKVWGEQNKLWPSTLELMGLSDRAFSGLSPKDQIKTVVRNHLNGLKANPVSIEVLADELMAPTEVTDALRGARTRLGREHQAIHAATDSMRQYDNRSMVMILLAAANYFAMRSVRAPRFMGEQIDTPEGWASLLARFDRVVDLALAERPVKTAAERVQRDAKPAPI